MAKLLEDRTTAAVGQADGKPAPPSKLQKSVSWCAEIAATHLATPRSFLPGAFASRRPSTPETPSRSLLIAFGLTDDDANARRAGFFKEPWYRRNRVAILVVVVVLAAALLIFLLPRDDASVVHPVEDVDDARDMSPIVRTAATIQYHYRNCTEVASRPVPRVACAVRQTVSRLRHYFLKHAVKLFILLSFGFSPIPFALSFI